MTGQAKQKIYSPGSAFVVRVAGLPVDPLRCLRFDQTMKLIEELLDGDRWLKAQAEPLSNALYIIISTVADKQVRQRLIALRRAIFQSRMPRLSDLDEQVWAALPGELATRVGNWLERIESWLTKLSGGQAVLEAEWTEKRRSLRTLASSELFQQGLVLASKDLYADLLRWQEKTDEITTHADRKFELGLFTYLARVMTKSSPYSTFTGSTPGQWVKHGPALTCSTAGWQRQGAIELNWSIAHRIASELTRWPEIRPALTLKINSSLLEEETTLRFLGWKGAEVAVKLGNSPTLQQILRVIRSTARPSYRTTVRALALNDSQNSELEIERFLEELITLGLLGLDFDIPDQAPDYLGQLLERLKAFRGPRVETMSTLLRTLQSSLRRYAHTLHALERFDLMSAIYATLRSIYLQLGLDPRVDLPTKNAFYENTVVMGVDACCSLAGWREVLADLSLLQELSGLYNAFLPGRLATSAFFVDHYGADAQVSLLSFYETFCSEARHDADWRPDYRVSGSHLLELFESPVIPPTVHLAELEQITSLQNHIARWFEQQPGNLAQGYQLDRAMLRAFVARFPSYITPSRSLDIYGQVFFQDGKPSFVLNAMHNGFGRSQSRLKRLLSEIPVRDVPGLYERVGETRGPLHAEIQGAFGTNVNLRTAQAPYEIIYPGCVSARPAEQQIPLSDLQVVHDPRTGHLRLMSSRLKCEIVPLHLGQAAHFWLPPLYRFLVQVFSEGGTDSTRFSLLQPRERLPGADLSIHSFPRVSLGHVVIERAGWIVGAPHLPRRERGQSPFDYMLKVQRWRDASHIPQECFVRALPAGPQPRGEHVYKHNSLAKMNKNRKPLYIDFRNYLCLLVFEQLVNQTGQVMIFQEVLPNLDELVLFNDGAPYASEYVFELTCLE